MKYKKDDILVSTGNTEGGRKKGDIIVMRSSINYLYGIHNRESNFSSQSPTDLRYATFEEILAYKRGIRNISELPDVPQPLPIFN